MRKGKNVIGQDVFSLADGLRIESVTDLVINGENDAILALLVDEGGLMESSKVVPVAAVHRFGPDAVMVQDADVILEADDIPEIKEILDRESTLVDRRVLTAEGEDLGAINDMYFDEATGQIRGFEVSEGTLGDVMRGTSYLPLEKLKVVGPDAVVATLDTKEHLEGQTGGLAGAAEDARDRAQELGDRAGDKASELGDRVGEIAEEAQDRDATLVGRRARNDVADRQGSIIVANGQVIELDHVREARDAGVIDELYAATGSKRQKTAGEQASETADDISESASDLWDRFTTKLSELTDSAGQRIDAEQAKRRLGSINDAIGRPVTKVILDRDDEVILDVGDIVTHKAVQRAHEAGMLDSLIDSVHRADPSFEREELKAKVEADATLENASGGADVVDELEQRRDQTDDEQNDDEQNDGSGDEQEERSDERGASPGGARSKRDEPVATKQATPTLSHAGPAQPAGATDPSRGMASQQSGQD